MKVVFLGTGGARFVVMRQIRASGGLWIEEKETRLLLDPGPGSLIRILKSKQKLNPSKLSGIILSHRHLDHCSDVNIMIEAMTDGGFRKRGVLFAPGDALEDDPVVFRYVREYLEKVEVLEEGKRYKIKDVEFETPVKHIHGVETYGFNFYVNGGCRLSIITDTAYFDELPSFYPAPVLIVHVVRKEPSPEILHLSIPDVEKIIERTKADRIILTHFGMTLLKEKPWKVAEELSKRYGKEVTAAYDGMVLSC
ncbi:hypothetical protein DRQ18_01245 [bacterium]|nr:MAG: hypothetical protein DRQ18_01245 [bacterium]